jgi:hypothetical protein
MKQPGMDLATGLTRTAARKILDRAGIQVPDKVDAIEVFVKEFGGESLIDVKNVAEEMIELERMGRSIKSMDEILEQDLVCLMLKEILMHEKDYPMKK